MSHSDKHTPTSPTKVNQKPPEKDWLKTIWKWISHNWKAKLLALLAATALWAGLISQDPSLTREKIFNDFPIRTSGVDTMNRNGYIVVSDLEDALKGVYLRAAVPQMQFDGATVSSYDPRIDLSRISGVGTQQLKVLTTATSTYGAVEAISPDTIEVEVEEYITRSRIPLTLSAVGTSPDGFYADAPNADPPNISVSGPKSLVETIARAEAVVDVSTLPAKEGLARTSVPFTLLNSQGKVVESKLITVSSNGTPLDSVIAEQMVYPTKELYLSALGLTKGTPADGYEVKSVSADPKTVVAAGASSSLDQLEMIFLEDAVDVQDAFASFNEEIRIRKRDELVHLSADKVMVAVEIGEIINGKTFENLTINLYNPDKSMKTTLSETKTSAVVTGPKLWLDKVKANQVLLAVDLTGLGEGTYELPVLGTMLDSENIPYTIEPGVSSVWVTIAAT